MGSENPETLTQIHALAGLLESELAAMGVRQINDAYFDTPRFEVPGGKPAAERIRTAALASRLNLRYRGDGTINVALDETTDAAGVAAIVTAFAAGTVRPRRRSPDRRTAFGSVSARLARTSSFLAHRCSTHHSAPDDALHQEAGEKDVGSAPP